jgi:ethanolamine utilization protein EutQ (cupin superfamily)
VRAISSVMLEKLSQATDSFCSQIWKAHRKGCQLVKVSLSLSLAPADDFSVGSKSLCTIADKKRISFDTILVHY